MRRSTEIAISERLPRTTEDRKTRSRSRTTEDRKTRSRSRSRSTEIKIDGDQTEITISEIEIVFRFSVVRLLYFCEQWREPPPRDEKDDDEQKKTEKEEEDRKRRRRQKKTKKKKTSHNVFRVGLVTNVNQNGIR